MDFAYELNQASGLDLEACSCVCHRWEAGFPMALDNGESWIVDFHGDDNLVERQVPALFTGLWRSATGVVFAAHRGGRMFRRPALGEPWSIFQLADSLYGVWGLSDDHVYAWGLVAGDHAMFHYDGESWSRMEAPPSSVVSIHGLAPDLLMAVGDRGMICSWNGRSWTRTHSPIRTALSSVFVVSASEMYACGPSDHTLLEGSAYGWAPILHAGFPLHAVAKFAGKIWVAAGVNGLYTLDENHQLARAETDLTPLKFDARGTLIISAIDRVAHTPDGVEFDWFRVEGVMDLVDQVQPCFY